MATETPNDDLVQVFDTEQESEAMVVKALLDSAGIEALVSSLDAPQDILPGVGGVILRVPQGRAAEAREIIETYRNTPVSDSDILESGGPETP